MNNVVRMVNTTGIISTVAGNDTNGYSGDGGQATSAALSSPRGVALDSQGNFYFSDQNNNRVREVNTPLEVCSFLPLPLVQPVRL